MNELRRLLDRRLGERGGKFRPTIAVAMANNTELIRAIGEALEAGIARFVLIGPTGEIERVAGDGAVALSEAMETGAVDVIEETDPGRACARAARMAANGEAEVLMKGLVQTSEFVRAVLDRDLGLVAKGGLLSHVAICGHGGSPFLFSDAAINTYPDAERKRTIIENAVTCATGLGISDSRVALVAPSEKVSDKIPSTTDAAEIVEAYRDDARVRDGGLAVDGPFGLDVATRAEAAATKGIGGPVAGRANILILPNIDAGNVLYKSLTGFAGAHVAGIVAGANVPIVLTSRADSERSKADSLRLALAVRPE